MINLDQIKRFLLLYFSKQFIYFLIAGGLSALLNFLWWTKFFKPLDPGIVKKKIFFLSVTSNFCLPIPIKQSLKKAIIAFIKLERDREIIAMYSLGLSLENIRKPIISFAIFIGCFYIILNFFISPFVYDIYN